MAVRGLYRLVVFRGSVRCTENTEVRCREEKVRSDEDTNLIQIESKNFPRSTTPLPLLSLETTPPAAPLV